jgi:hypothetical protein
MAQIFPSDLSALLADGTHPPEVDTLRRLRDELPESFSVYHGIHWTREFSGYCLFGEIDFVVVNPIGHILVIEQKNGAIEESRNQLTKWYGGKSKNVVDQLLRSIDVMRDKYGARRSTGAGLHIDYLLFLPDHVVKSASAVGLSESRIVDSRSSSKLPQFIESLLAGKTTDSAADRNQVIDFLTQTLRLVPDVSSYIAAQDRAFTMLTNSLADTVARLEFKPFRLRVLGAAGCGKSQLALEFCARMVAQGRRPLFVCFNRPLADRIRPLLPAGGVSDTYHSFIDHVLSAHGARPDFGGEGQSPEFWRRLQEQVIAMQVPESAKHGALIVDEGQDFQPEWYDILTLFMLPEAAILWLEDPEQNIYRKEQVSLPGFVTYHDGRNFRTPRTISRFIERVLGQKVDACNRAEGLGAMVLGYESPSERPALVAHRIMELIRQGFRHEDIVVISCVGREKSVFRNLDQLGPFRLRRFTGAYTPDGQQQYTDSRILWDTLYRFKGQQAPTVILVDIEADSDEDRMRRLLYCGMTRATVRLELVVNAAHPLYTEMKAAESTVSHGQVPEVAK